MKKQKQKETVGTSAGSLEAARKELLKLRFRRAMGDAVSGSRFRVLRKSVARCLTETNKKKAEHA
ncbi:MAG: 50S ribosomal protein L29 [Holosporales bacterium]|jgi:ribosomal protein L29|nr:50S ribosomal protein L29 [Holosporales bacterium]